jgi:glycerol-3-phosphate acyltransferase PlsY
MQSFILIFVSIYLLGSINFSILVLRLFGKGDPRTWSSGNPGTFNIYRKYGLLWAMPVFLLDIGRAMGSAVVALRFVSPESITWVAFALVLGNRFPVFHRFRGGKGVAGFLGFTLVVAPLFAAIAAGCWVLVYRIYRETYIASFAMVALLAAGLVYRCGVLLSVVSAVLLTIGLIVHGHLPNLKQRLKRDG